MIAAKYASTTLAGPRTATDGDGEVTGLTGVLGLADGEDDGEAGGDDSDGETAGDEGGGEVTAGELADGPEMSAVVPNSCGGQFIRAATSTATPTTIALAMAMKPVRCRDVSSPGPNRRVVAVPPPGASA